MTFILGSKSRSRLIGVHPLLVQVVERAITLSERDFQVLGGVRSIAEQRAHVAAGTSWTMNSKHLPQVDGLGHAVDLVPLIAGELQWDWAGCFQIAAAMSAAARALHASLRWGGVWDRPLLSFKSTPAAARKASQDYVARRKREGKRAALDGPHFELLQTS